MAATATNPFQAIEDAARASKNAEVAAKTIAKARSQILLACDARSAFFGMLAMRLKPRADTKTETAVTDGRTLSYNPAWVAGLSEDEAIGFVAHEVLHCAMGHHARRGHRDIARWNVAGDLACNSVLLQCGYTLPSDAAVPGRGQYKDMPDALSAEDYYHRIQTRPGGGGGGAGAGSAGGGSADDGGDDGQDPGGCGGVQDAGDDADCREAEADWKAATAAAECEAKRRGDLPMGLDRAIEAAVHETADWREILRRFVSRSAHNDFTWSPPNRRLVHLGIYLPSIASDSLGKVVVAVDTSGSIGRHQLEKFAAEIQAVLDTYDVEVEIVYHDAAVQHVQTWRPEDGPLRLEAKGGGGTSHIPVFDRIAESGEDPTCLICLTDGESLFPETAPGFPVLWALTQDQAVPFGEEVRLPD